MEITGRLVADATVRAVNGDKNVTNFRIAINRSYTSQGEKKEETTYVDCGYWRTDALVEIMMNETTPFRRKLTHCFGAN